MIPMRPTRLNSQDQEESNGKDNNQQNEEGLSQPLKISGKDYNCYFNNSKPQRHME